MMKCKLEIPAWLQPYLVLAPSYHVQGPAFMFGLRQGLGQAECRTGALSQKEFGELLGVARSTVHDWCVDLPATIGALMCGLERLSQPERVRFLDEFCRDCPRLKHQSISHDPAAVGLLKGLLTQPAGLTLLRGESRRHRTFVLNALGNDRRRLFPDRQIGGLDMYDQAEFTGVPGIFYFRPRRGFNQEDKLVMDIWQLLQKSNHEILLLNGVLATAPEILPDLIAASKTRHVIVADDFPGGLPQCHATVVRVAPDSPRNGLLRINAVRIGRRD